MEKINKNLKIYWNNEIANTELEKFQKFVERKHKIKFDSYWDFHRWSVELFPSFWEAMWKYFEIISSEPYKEVFVKTGTGFLDNEWFSGAKFNYAENLLRIRDDRVALICLDELNREEIITFSDIFEEVKLYTSAFRKNGLKIGDRVACYMSNRKEAIFAMLAVASIGALWGGPGPYYGAKAASNIIKMIEPKFLITIDSHLDNGITFPTLEYLPEITDSARTIQKVILVVTQEETRYRDISKIRNCVFVDDFLKEGQAEDGSVPDIIFEQLSFNHPLNINFTSGTTGLPKAVIHSAGTLLSIMRDYALTYDMKSGDVVCMNYPVGWSLWDNYIPCLGMGLTLFLYAGSVYYSINGRNFWDILAQYKVKMVILITSMVDKMEKMQMVPSSNTNMKHLKEVVIAGSPVKKENFEYLLNQVDKDLFVGILYGATEVFGTFSGLNLNMPVYGGEIQVPSLGIDMQCFDSKGNSIVGRRGELVICKPAVNFLLRLWNDQDNIKLTSTYLSKFSGVWVQHDECWINPKTRGLVIIGRSDETLKQKGERFGSAEIYFAIHSLDELQDYICVSQQRFNGDTRAILFVQMKQGLKLTPEIRAKIEKKINEELYEECVPELILEVEDIPYNLNNKRMESLVRKIVQSNRIPEVMNIRNPKSLRHFVDITEVVNYNKDACW